MSEPTLPPAPETTDASLAVGTVVDGRFRVDSFLAEGGMGRVYVGTQLPLGRKVALKVMRASLIADPASKRRFLQEAVAVSRLDHPNTIKVYDFGEVGGHVYIAMEFIDGRSLQSVLTREQALPLDRVFLIAEQILLSLAEAHEKGIVHRDLKPDNIFLADIAGSRDFVKVLDFGIAKLAEPVQGTRLTMEGFVCGTPDYMAPEQAIAEPVDGRTDLYALGVMLYEMISGELPFTGNTPVAVLLRHQHEPPPPLPDTVPAAVRSLVVRLLAKRPGDRPQTAVEVLDEIGSLRDQLTAAGLMKPSSDTQRRSLRTSRAPVTLGTAATQETRSLSDLVVSVRQPPAATPAAPSRPAWLLPGAAAAALTSIAALVWVFATPAPAPPPAAAPATRAAAAPAATPTPPATSPGLRVNSEPAGAEVYQDGAFVGRTPVKLALSGAEGHAIELRKPGFATFTRDVAPLGSGAAPTPIDARLEPVQVVVRLTSQPPDARAEIVWPGAPAGVALPPGCQTPCEQRLPFGARAVRVIFSHPGYLDGERSLDVSSEEPIDVAMTLQPNRARATGAGRPASPAPAPAGTPTAAPPPKSDNPFRIVDHR